MAKAEKESTATQLSHSARRINALARRFDSKRYLEVGVASGRTFSAVEIEKKTAVDPYFRFDWKSRESSDVTFFEMTSDDWFLKHSQGATFDLIFLDGLHTFEQTFRDFCNSLSVAHPGTMWLLDDTVPSDVFSAWPNQKEAIAYRKEGLGPFMKEGRQLSGRWHGDVFKTVFAIHDFFPMLSYCTIRTHGNPQTLVWRKPRADFAPLFNNFESISRLNYFDLKKHFSVMRPVSESEALNDIVGTDRVLAAAPASVRGAQPAEPDAMDMGL